MENQEYEEVVDYLVNGYIPYRLSGRINKDRRKTFKGKCTHLALSNDASTRRDNSRCLLRITKSGNRIVLRESDLVATWEHFHLDPTTGGHNGIYTMSLTIRRKYYMPKMKEWLSSSIKNCNTCRQTTLPAAPAPTKAELPKRPNLMWQMDYISPFPPDTRTGSRYGLVVIDCHSKITMAFSTNIKRKFYRISTRNSC